MRLVDIMKYLKKGGSGSKGIDSVWRRVAWWSGGIGRVVSCAHVRQRRSAEVMVTCRGGLIFLSFCDV